MVLIANKLMPSKENVHSLAAYFEDHHRQYLEQTKRGPNRIPFCYVKESLDSINIQS